MIRMNENSAQACFELFPSELTIREDLLLDPTSLNKRATLTSAKPSSWRRRQRDGSSTKRRDNERASASFEASPTWTVDLLKRPTYEMT